MYNGILINKGQMITSRKSISEKTKIQESKVERTLKLLEKLKYIEQQTTTKYRLISVTLYDFNNIYEQQANSKRTAREQHVNSKRTQSTSNTSKQVGQVNTPNVDEISFAFSTFYENYGVKKSKGQALKAFNKLNHQDIQKVLDVVQSEEFQKYQRSLIKKDGDFRQHPSTWLNGIGWDNDFTIQEKQSNPPFTQFQDNEEPF